MQADEETLPLKAGCWVIQGSGTGLQVAKVKDCYRLGGKVLIDLWIHSTKGENLGRTSPVMGGPRTFEPACDLDGWVRIEPPSFPLRKAWVPSGDGKRTMGYSGTTVIPFGEFAPRRPRAATRAAPRRSDYDPQSEAASRRLAAQEMRDLARSMPSAAAELRERAVRLEAEADGIAPRR